ncbi:Amidophosphoribosyltransferase protein [Vigna angularis]|uniref:Amidophosphoribosyltransferase protein n=1 Tax=Phaseolus angularis TaxID=3914 RepID=A0A8T0KII6_PHAAN|nr:Amidophosphoribosyltransferase protein [Vigna angularis]
MKADGTSVQQGFQSKGYVMGGVDGSSVELPGSCAIANVRYSTAGHSKLVSVQPFVAGYRFGSVAVAHNGNFVNYRSKLEDNGSIFNMTSDTEVVLHLIATSKHRPFLLRVVNACENLKGAYSLVFLTEDKLVAVRDPFGFRPLVMGRRKNGAMVFASETCALDLIDATYEREVNPSEVVVVDHTGIQSLCLVTHQETKQCIFEHIYFALPNYLVFRRSVYESRRKFGEILTIESPVECDVVIAVPDSGVVVVLGYAAKARVPFQQGFIRVSSTIQPDPLAATLVASGTLIGVVMGGRAPNLPSLPDSDEPHPAAASTSASMDLRDCPFVCNENVYGSRFEEMPMKRKREPKKMKYRLKQNCDLFGENEKWVRGETRVGEEN